MRRHLSLSIVALPLILVFFLDLNREEPTVVKPSPLTYPSAEQSSDDRGVYSIAGIVKSGETLDAIFRRHNLDRTELAGIFNSSKKDYNLSRIRTGNIYSFELERKTNTIVGMNYGIDDDLLLSVKRGPAGYESRKITIEPEKRIGSFNINVQGNLIVSMPGRHREYNRLALKLSDIYAWDIDFSNDLRNGDTVRIVAEELWVGEVFKGYGDILAAEFINNGNVLRAYRFEHDGYVDYYDSSGRSMRKALLRSPLKFKYISSGFTKRRFHPILRRYRPHLGIDYAAPKGTPVSAAGSGKVIFAGYKGQNGRMVRIRHNGGYETYYGHLSRIPKNIRKGAKVSQGDIVGYVGSTGLSTGPHLDYRMKRNGKFVNPLKVKMPRGKSVPKNLRTAFKKIVDRFDSRFALLSQPLFAYRDTVKRRES